jgi:hypothetical protein
VRKNVSNAHRKLKVCPFDVDGLSFGNSARDLSILEEPNAG